MFFFILEILVSRACDPSPGLWATLYTVLTTVRCRLPEHWMEVGGRSRAAPFPLVWPFSSYPCKHMVKAGKKLPRFIFFFFLILTEQMETCLLTLFILFPPFHRCSFFLFIFPVLSLELFYLPNTKYWIYLPKLGKGGSVADLEKIVCSFLSEGDDPPRSSHSPCYPSHAHELSNRCSGQAGWVGSPEVEREEGGWLLLGFQLQ